MTSDLVKLLPRQDVALLLVDNYFAKIHWFILLFHQRYFRQRMHALYATSNPHALVYETADESTIGYTSVLLAVFALSLRYLNANQQRQLEAHGIMADEFREKILTTLRLRILDILALGSLEAVQLCILLNGFYLYHGEPEAAWPLCGCGLRLAQALELHRHLSHTRNTFSQLEIEDRKRCWWALHEAETYCSMVYGFPLGFVDADCDAETLNPRDPWSIGADSQAFATNKPTLLEYKCAMSTLAMIVKSVLQELYQPQQATSVTRSESTGDGPPLEKVKLLQERLERWFAKLPKQLRMEQLSNSSFSSSSHGNSVAALATNLSFEQKLFHLQALSLKLAYESAKILICRPLLSVRLDSSSVFVDACFHAALQISWAGHVPIFQEAATTYALNSIALHLLTAGIVLCVVASANPLADNAFQAKLGIRRLMEMQLSLQDNSIMAEQGLQILKKLLSRVMQRETAFMLRTEPERQERTQAEEPRNQSRRSLRAQPIPVVEGQARTDSQSSIQVSGKVSEDASLSIGVGSMPEGEDTSVDFLAAHMMLDIEEGKLFPSPTYHPVLLTTAACNITAFRYSDFYLDADGYDESNILEPYKSSTVGQDQGWIWDTQLGFDAFS